MAGLYNGHILEFPQIRVDCFTQPPGPSKSPWLLPDPCDPSLPHRLAPPAQLFLLTHVHTDHLIGLDNQFTGKLVCSHDTKRMLLRLEAEKERNHFVNGVRETRKKKYDGLKGRVVDRGTKDERVVDYIEAVPYGVPRVYEIGYQDDRLLQVTITLIEANHCPGSTMFLITSPERAVLHTGDIRADDLFIKSLRRNPIIGPFIAPTGHCAGSSAQCGRRTLDRMYIDTSAIVGTGDMPDKEVILQELVEQISLYPPDTVFFLDVWCFGWEDVVKEVARHFGSLVHVDCYKKEIYESVVSDPFLSACITLDPTASRFHACERRSRCEECRVFNKAGEKVWNTEKRIVLVNMVEVKSASWELERKSFVDKLGQAAIGQGQWPNSIECPIARHSPLPEIQRLVKMFRPNGLSPNTIAREAQGLDYYLLPEYFEDCLSSSKALQQLTDERDRWFRNHKSFGPTYLHNMKSAKTMGMCFPPGRCDTLGSAPKMRQVVRQETVGSTKRGRGSHAADQLSRLVGIPKLSAEDMKVVMAALTNSVDSKPLYGGTRLDGAKTGSRALPSRTEESCIDVKTEEIRDISEDKAKRRKIRTFNDHSALETLGGVTVSKSDSVNSVKTAPAELGHDQVNPPWSRDNSAQKLVSSSPSPVTPTPFTHRVSLPDLKVRPRRSFMVDKEHLRALAMVAAEVDDL